MKKKISFIIESESDDESIKSYLKRWIKDNFKFPEEEIKIEEVKDEEKREI